MGRSVSYPRGALVAFSHIEDEMDYLDWQDMLDNVRDHAMSLWPSLYEADHWRGREDHVIAANSLVEFGISEYCGLVAYWLVPLEKQRTRLSETLKGSPGVLVLPDH